MAAPREDLRIEVAIERPDGTRVVAPRVTCHPAQRSNVSVVRPYTYVKDFDIEVGQDGFHADPILETLHEGVWLDMVADRAPDGGIELKYTLRRAALKRPVETYTTTLGAFTKPVTIQIPELVTDELEGTCRLQPGVEARLARIPVGDGPDPITVFARVTGVAVEVAQDGADVELDPR